MKKSLIKILILIITLSTVFALSSCSAVSQILENLNIRIPGISGGDDDVEGGNDTDEGLLINGGADLVLIKNGVANFRVVFTSDSGSDGKRAANTLVTNLRSYGVTIEDAVSDGDASAVSDCEIIIGLNARNRDENSGCLSDKTIGKRGQYIKVVGTKVIIAAGASATNSTTYLLEKFLKDQMGISYNKTTSVTGDVVVNAAYEFIYLTEYTIKSITVGNNNLSDYTFILDVADVKYSKSSITSFQNSLYDISGCWMKSGVMANKDSYEHCFIVRYVDKEQMLENGDTAGNGFRAYVDGDDIIVECCYANAFDTAFSTFANSYFLSKTGNIKISGTLDYKTTVSKVYYSEFGAVGDGKTNDFLAIYNTHVYANQGGQKVYGDAGATYFISTDYSLNDEGKMEYSGFTKTIPIQTDVDFNGATFLVDDTGDAAYQYRSTFLFTLARQYETVTFTDSNSDGVIDDERFQGVTVEYTDIVSQTYNSTTHTYDYVYEDLCFDWLGEELQAKSLVILYNSKHKDFVRHGSNQNSGNTRMDVFIVDKVTGDDGEGVHWMAADDTPCTYPFDNITKIEIFRVDDDPITVENGNFQNICCRAVSATLYKNVYKAYHRGFRIYRANSTLQNITHEMIDEPDLGWYTETTDYNEDVVATDNLYSSYGSRHESYPYYGFYNVYTTYNIYLKDSILDGHTTYYEDKPATASTGGVVPDPVPMGSYDLILEYSSNIYLDNVVQRDETGLGDSRYWGIMSSNVGKNYFFDNCKINRFDAHRGFWNAEITNSTIGHSINVIGGGYLLLENVEKLTGVYFLYFRGDYGATFRGDISIIDCHYYAYKSYSTSKGGSFTGTSNTSAVIIQAGYNTSNSGYTDGSTSGAYWLWDFGYTSYMPINLIIQNYTCDATSNYVFNSLPDIIFEKTYTTDAEVTSNTVRYPYQITKSVTFLGGNEIPLVSDASTYTALASIRTYALPPDYEDGEIKKD